MTAPDLRSEHQKRISEAMKLWWARRRREGWASRNSRLCEGCGQNRVPLGQRICEGCDAYRDHTGHF
jgi:hypothetical protein